MNQKMNAAFNAQINREYYSAFLYLAMSEWLDEQNWDGASHWMFNQYKEEISHAEGMIAWLRRRGGRLELKQIDAPTTTFKSILDVFEQGLAHEELVTRYIHELTEIADEVKDISSRTFLDWYVMEQVEEEENATNIINEIKKYDSKVSELYHLDARLGARSFEAPAIPYLN